MMRPVASQARVHAVNLILFRVKNLHLDTRRHDETVGPLANQTHKV